MQIPIADVVVPALLVWSYSLLLAAVANHLIAELIPESEAYPRLRFCLAFFVGVSCFGGVWRFLTLGLSVKGSLAIVTLAVVTYAVWQNVFARAFRGATVVGVVSYLALAAGLHVFVLCFWAQDTPDSLNGVMAVVGSMHSPRYGNFAIYLAQFDRVPIVQQNYGQSMLASIGCCVGYVAPLYALNLWAAVSQFFMVVLTFEFLRLTLQSTPFAVLGTCFVFLSNAALSTEHVLACDLGWPLLVNSYSDAQISLGSLSATLAATAYLLRTPASRPLWIAFGLVMTASAYWWTMSAIQNLYLYGVGAIALAVWSRAAAQENWRPIAATVAGYLAATVLGAFSGGMLTPERWIEQVPFAGMLTIRFGDFPLVSLNFGLPMAKGSYLDWRILNYANEDLGTRIFESVIGCGIPLLGVLFALSWLREDRGPLDRRAVWVMIVVLAAGLLVALPIMISNTKWTISRFLLAGYYYTLLLFFIAAYTRLSSVPRDRYFLFLVVIAACWGPVRDIDRRMRANFGDPVAASKQVEAIFTFSTLIK